MTWWTGQRISSRGVLLLLGMLVFTSMHLVACAHGPNRAGGDTLTSAPVVSALCQPRSALAPPDQEIARGDGSPESHHGLCGVALDRLPDPRPRLAHAPMPSGVPAAPSGAVPTVHERPTRPGVAAHHCEPAGSGTGTLNLLCVSRT